MNKSSRFLKFFYQDGYLYGKVMVTKYERGIEMKKTIGGKMIFAGGILELILAVTSVVVIALFLANVSPEFLTQYGLSPEGGVKATFGFYGCAILHVLAFVIAFVCMNHPKRYMLALVIGVLLIVVTNIFTDWKTAGFLTFGINMLPGALIIGGALINKKSLGKSA